MDMQRYKSGERFREKLSERDKEIESRGKLGQRSREGQVE